tara:strand:- start:147 stop:1472 length:1326 start_codon:yes stop_codon:yes gene_type:complete
MHEEYPELVPRPVLALEYDGCADLMAFYPTVCKSDEDRERWLLDTLRCALLDDPKTIRCASLAGRASSELSLDADDAVFSPLAQEDMIFTSVGLRNAFPFLKQIKASYEAFQKDDQPLIMILAGIRQSDEIDKNCSKTQQQTVTAMHAMNSMTAALNQILPGFCEFKPYRLQDLAGIAQTRLSVPKDDFQLLTLIYQMQMLSADYPDQAFNVTTCMTQKPELSRDLIGFFELNRMMFPSGVQFHYVDATRSHTADGQQAIRSVPVYDFNKRLEGQVFGFDGHGKKLEPLQLAEIYDRMTTFLYSSDYARIRQDNMTQKIANNEYIRALQQAFSYTSEPARYQRDEVCVINSIINNLSKRKTFSSTVSDSGRVRRLNQLKNDLQSLVDSYHKSNQSFKERTELNTFLSGLRKITDPKLVSKGSDVSIRDVQGRVSDFSRKKT